MSSALPRDVLPEGRLTGTIRSYQCLRCGEHNEFLWKGWVPADHYNTLVEYVRAAAGNDFVLLSAQTVSLLGDSYISRKEIERYTLRRSCGVSS